MDKAVIIFTDNCASNPHFNISNGDVNTWKQICDPSTVQIIGPFDVSKWTSSSRFYHFFKKIHSHGIKKIIIYYAGTTYNNNLTSFPAIKINYNKFLTHHELIDIINKCAFDLVIIGYDAGTANDYTITYNPLTYIVDQSNEPCIDRIWNNTGSLYFTCYGLSYTRTIYNMAGECRGLFTHELCKLLLHTKSWKETLCIICHTLSNMNMTLYYQDNLVIQKS